MSESNTVVRGAAPLCSAAQQESIHLAQRLNFSNFVTCSIVAVRSHASVAVRSHASAILPARLVVDPPDEIERSSWF
jgi:hypothetical protein